MLEWMDSAVFWFFFGVLLFVLELATPGFVLLFFGIGAWLVALIMLLFEIPLVLQLLIFLITSILSLVFLRNRFSGLFKGFRKGNVDPSKNFDDYTGKVVKVIETINPPNRGKVELYGTNWDAESDQKLDVGSSAEIISKENIILKVKPKY